MPSTKHQFNVVLDEATEGLIWDLVSEERTTPTKILRSLIATHPRILAKAEEKGVIPEPLNAEWGGKREAKKQDV